MTRLRAGFLLTASFTLLMPVSAQSASFNCRLADKPDEVLICQSRELSVLDDRMSSLYFTLRNRLRGAQRSALEVQQTAWLRGRMACGRDYGCVLNAYNSQIQLLLNWR
jgi:uncharacterized protein